MALNREKVIRNAEKYVSKGKLEAAIKEYRKVLRENPNDTNTLNRVGDLYARLERYDEAVRLFSQIAEKYTDDGFFVKAIAIYKKIIKFDPSALSVYERLAELYHRQGLLNESRAQFQFLADYYLKNNNLTSATNIYLRMSEIEPDDPTYKLKLAELYEKQRLSDKAAGEYRALAQILVNGGSADEAVQIFHKALEILPGDLDYARDAVTMLHERGHTGAAAKVLARAVDLNPEAQSIADVVAMAEAEGSGVHRGGTEDATQVPVADPNDPFAVPTGFEVDVDDFDDLDAAAAEAMAAIDAADDSVADVTVDEDGTVDRLDLDSESEYEIQPPDDLVEVEMEDEFDIDLEIDVDEPDDDAFEIDLEAGDDAAVDESGPEVDDFAFEIDMDDDLEPVEAAAAEDDPAVEEAAEDDAFDLGDMDDIAADLDDEPVEAEAVEAEAAEPEVEFDLEPEIELEAAPELGEPEPVALEPAEPETAAEIDEPAPVRREEDLVAEAKVFEKYGLEEKARDRLEELLEVNPRHAEGLLMLARMELAAEEMETARALADRLGQVVLDTGEIALYDELRGDFAAAGVLLADIAGSGHIDVAAPVDDEEVFAGEAETVVEPADGLTLEDAAPLDAAPEHAVSEDATTEEAMSEPADAVAEAAAIEGEDLAEDETVISSASAAVEAPAPAPSPAPAAAPAVAKPKKGKSRDRIAQLLEDLSLDGFDSPTPARRKKSGVEALLDSVTPAQDETPAQAPAASEPEPEVVAEAAPTPTPTATATPTPEPAPQAPSAAPAGGGLFSLKDELGLDDIVDADDEPVEAPAPSAVEPAPTTVQEAAEPEIDQLDETGMSWLDEEPAQDEAPVAAASAEEESLFDDEDDFFDLAAELEAELGTEGMKQVDGDMTSLESQEGSLEDIIEGFKAGVAEHLSEEDYDTHFNLGIAYREMGLLDEAIGEFQLASKDERYLAESASMLGLCFVEKGLPELAVRWYKKGLESPMVTEDATLGLLYDLGDAYVSMGESESAYRTFLEIYGMNTNFRDAASRMQELAPQAQA